LPALRDFPELPAGCVFELAFNYIDVDKLSYCYNLAVVKLKGGEVIAADKIINEPDLRRHATRLAQEAFLKVSEKTVKERVSELNSALRERATG
jgi:hypothetical protein